MIWHFFGDIWCVCGHIHLHQKLTGFTLQYLLQLNIGCLKYWYAIASCTVLGCSLVPRLPCLGTQTLKLCRQYIFAFRESLGTRLLRLLIYQTRFSCRLPTSLQVSVVSFRSCEVWSASVSPWSGSIALEGIRIWRCGGSRWRYSCTAGDNILQYTLQLWPSQDDLLTLLDVSIVYVVCGPTVKICCEVI